MYKILSNQKSRVIDGKYSKDNYIFLVEQAYKRNKITKAQYHELIEFENE
jgi:hypothetical protein